MEKTGGIMFWALDHDAQGEFSLVNAIYQIVHQTIITNYQLHDLRFRNL